MKTPSSMIARPAGVGLMVLGIVTSAPINGQPIAGGQASHITIPFLANATRLADLSFEGAECDVDQSGNTMACQFQQVFFTTSDIAPQTCLVTTNRYARTFKKQGPLDMKAPGGPLDMKAPGGPLDGKAPGGPLDGKAQGGKTRWVSNEPPEGVCGVTEVTTLQDDGGVRWTMATRKLVTRKAAASLCRDLDERPDTLSWQNLRRPLPCAFIQPGGITR